VSPFSSVSNETQSRRTTFSKFIIEEESRTGSDPSLTALLNDVQTACKFIALAVSRGALHSTAGIGTDVNVQGETQKPLDVIANNIMLDECARGGTLCGMVSEELPEPSPIPESYRHGRYLLVFDPLDGSSNLDVNVTVGTIFSVLLAGEGVTQPETADFLQPGSRQIAAGFALYGPCSMIVLTLGHGVHGFTLDREIGAYTLTHPDMKIPKSTREFAINASNERFWEPPVRHYVDECVRGKTGPRGEDFNMRWVASMVAEVYRILVRGGLFMYPRDTKDPGKPGRLRLLYEASPMAMIVEQAGGLATTGRERLLDVEPTSLHQRVPVILGSSEEVERLTKYHAAYDRGEDLEFESPLFNVRSMFRSTAGS
jgi:fructose-1,6-bisphosphatase I